MQHAKSVDEPLCILKDIFEMKDLFGVEVSERMIPKSSNHRLSPDRLRTLKAETLISQGYHPFGYPLVNNGKTCKDCSNCKATGKRHTHNYYKCLLKGNSRGPGTDLRLKWPACIYFKEK